MGDFSYTPSTRACYNKLMSSAKIFLTILGILLIAGFGFVVATSYNRATVQMNSENPVPIPTQPIQEGAQTPSTPIENPTTAFNQPITLSLNGNTTLPDGLNVMLEKINDSRCPQDVQCIWAGELSAILKLSGGKLKADKEISLGTTNNKSVSLLEGYKFSLQDATTDNIDIIVAYNPVVSTAPCFVSGCGGQVCSEQVDHMTNCQPTNQKTCYTNAKCQRQMSGQCGWTPTAELQACLSAQNQ